MRLSAIQIDLSGVRNACRNVRAAQANLMRMNTVFMSYTPVGGRIQAVSTLVAVVRAHGRTLNGLRVSAMHPITNSAAMGAAGGGVTVPPQDIQYYSTLAANELGISSQDVIDGIEQGLYETKDILEYLEGKASKANKFVRHITRAKDILFTVKDGYVIVSGFTRNSFLNRLVKSYNDGTGIGTRYLSSTLSDTPVLGTIYRVGQVAETLGKAAEIINTTITVYSDVVDAAGKINDIWNDQTTSTKEKAYDTAAVVATSAVGVALDVAAPIAGTAVTTAVTAAIPIPVVNVIVGVAAGEVVESSVKLVADIVTSEAVVNQVSDSLECVGDSLVAGYNTVSIAAKELLQSENALEAINNTAALVGDTLVAGAEVTATMLVGGVKTATTIVSETAKATGKVITDVGKNVANFFKSW